MKGGSRLSNKADFPGTPLTIATQQAVIDDLHERLRRTRFPKEQAGPDWATGSPIAYMRRLCDYWLNDFDWRAWETRLNQFENRIVSVGGHSIHVLIERGSGVAPLPLLMTHGWPGSVIELHPVIERLAHPERFGGRAEDGFTIIAPSLPGYGFSPPPPHPLSPADIAGIWSSMMIEVFGVDRYVAYGSDWGSLVTARLAFQFPHRLAAILITTSGGVPVMDEKSAPLTEDEIAWGAQSQARLAPESGYQMVQATKPQSLAYGQTDSPIGLAAWIVEKFHDWTIQGSQSDPPFAMEHLLANIMLYWINGCVAPMWLYLHLSAGTSIGPGIAPVPAGFVFGPSDMTPPAPRAFLERCYKVEHYSVLERGGHFPGMESPEALAGEIQAFLGKRR